MSDRTAPARTSARRRSAPTACRSSSPIPGPGASRRPTRRPTELRAAEFDVYVHAPYLINVCSPKPNVRYGSRKILQQTCDAAAAIGAAAVIVHGGHAEDDIAEGLGRWLRSLEMLETEVKVLIENTAGGENAVARRFDALAALWEALARRRRRGRPRLLLRHLPRARGGRGPLRRRSSARSRSPVGIDLLHANDSRDPAGTGADRHANLGAGQVDVDALRHDDPRRRRGWRAGARRDAGPATTACAPTSSSSARRWPTDYARRDLERESVGPNVTRYPV